MLGRLYGFVWVVVLFCVIAGCGTTETETADKTAPTLSTKTPSSDATNVSTGTTISATFSENINIDSFTLSATDSGVQINGTTSGNGSATVTFTPSSSLASSTKYTATVKNARDGSGNNYGDLSWSFTTSALLSGTSPSDGATVAASTEIYAQFSTSIASIDSFTLKLSDTNEEINGTVSNEGTNKGTKLSFKPSDSLIYGMKYKAEIKNATDYGGYAEDISWSFTLSSYTATTTPSDGETGLDPLSTSSISATFLSAEGNSVEVGSYDSFTLESENGSEIATSLATTLPSSTISWNLSDGLHYGTKYTVTAKNLKDSSGTIIMSELSWPFTMKSPTGFTYHATPDSTSNNVGQYNSMAISPVDGKIYATYYNSSNASLYVTSTSDGTVFSPTSALLVDSGGQYSSLAIDSSGTLHIVYYGASGGLKYAMINPSSWTIVYEAYADSTSSVGTYASLALDSNEKSHISYYDSTNAALKYVNNSSGSWSLPRTVDSSNVGTYSSIKVHTDGTVHISYYDAQNKNLKYVSSSDWEPETLDSTGDIGEYSSLFLDGDGNVYIAYNHVSAVDGYRRIRLISKSSGIWTHEDITTVSSLTSNPLFIDSDGKLHIDYYSSESNVYKLYYASKTKNGTSWSITKADESGIGNGVYTSIVADKYGLARIAYYDATEGDLKIAFQY